MRPHELPVFTAHGELDHPIVNERGDCYGLSITDLLAEPSVKSGQWIPSVIRRLIAASAQPIAVNVHGKHKERLESAGWFVANEDTPLLEAREACWPAYKKVRRLSVGYGCLAPKLILVGEKVTRAGQLPFASRSGTWLFRALRELGWDELQLYVLNIKNASGRSLKKRVIDLYDAFEAYEPWWITLGESTKKAFASTGIESVHIPHPDWHKRYRHHEDIAGYVKRMKDAGVPGGPNGISAFGRDTLPDLPKPYEISTVAYIKGSGAHKDSTARSNSSKLSTVLREKARALYITGEAKTFREAANQLGIDPEPIRSIARAENWSAEREEHHRELTEETKRKAIKAESDRIARCRSKAWESTELALNSIVDRLKSGELIPNERGAESLQRIAVSLAGGNFSAINEEEHELSSKPIAELAQLVLENHRKQFGEDL